jgi:hydroxymethylpyrimidine pyrophosphatase-like HAD family hydrolase
MGPDFEIINMHTLDKDIGDAVVETGSDFGIDPFVIGIRKGAKAESFLYPRRLNEYQKSVLKGYRDDPRLQFNPTNRTMEKNLKIVYFEEGTILKPLAERLKKDFGDAIEVKLSPEKYGGGYFLTILHPQGDKAHALEEVAAFTGSDLSDMTVFGDSINDLGMFAKAGRAVAVANALDEVKSAADIVLEHTNDEDGVAQYLERI